MYVIKFENLYYEKIWGCRDLEKFRDNLPDGNIGESWDVACHENGTGKIINGKLKGLTLNDVMLHYGDEVLGTKISKKKFPLLLKVISAGENLSLQVHPEDDYAMVNEHEFGKTEAWYVVEAQEGACLIAGTKKCTRDTFMDAINSGSFENYVNKIPVKAGDVVYVKSGLVHGIGAGITLVEIQQNSDTTYRVYDYNRGRELHVKKAMDVINFSLDGKVSRGITIDKGELKKTYYCLNKYFALEKYCIDGSAYEESDKERFFLFTCVNGSGRINYNNGLEYENIKKGESVMIPASLGKYTICGHLEMLKSYVPDVEKVENEILSNVR